MNNTFDYATAKAAPTDGALCDQYRYNGFDDVAGLVNEFRSHGGEEGTTEQIEFEWRVFLSAKVDQQRVEYGLIEGRPL